MKGRDMRDETMMRGKKEEVQEAVAESLEDTDMASLLSLWGGRDHEHTGLP